MKTCCKKMMRSQKKDIKFEEEEETSIKRHCKKNCNDAA